MANLDRWVRKVIERVNGAPEAIVRDEIAYVVSDFCREGYPWRYLTEPYSVAVGEAEVAVNPIDNRSKCIYVFRAYWGTMELANATERLPSDVVPGHPMAFVCEKAPDIITLLPSPSSETSEFRALVALAPRDPSVWVPDFFPTHHFEAVLDGTLHRFYSQPNKPYTNPDAAAYHFRQYRRRVNEARSMTVRGYTPSGQGWSFPQFGA